MSTHQADSQASLSRTTLQFSFDRFRDQKGIYASSSYH
jgi:hypothetical protein